MGVELTLHVVDLESPAMSIARTRLEIGKEYKFFEQLEKIVTSAVHGLCPDVYGHFREGYGKAPARDPYGAVLEWVEACRIVEQTDGVKFESPWVRGAIAYLQTIPPATPVILFWH
jgi:hypothetical protein